jgi:RHS repeat-associated protein
MDAYSGSSITPYYFHTNEIGSTTAVTDANGQVVERYKYGLFGLPTFMDAAGNVIPKSTIGNNILFQGREYEPETNFYYFRARHLDPIMGRFLQTDPMGYQDSLNLYQGLNMNPVNFVDPMGTELSAETIKYWGSYEKALKYVKYNYGLYLEGGDSAATAYNKLVSNGLITDTGGAYDRMFALKLAMSPSLDVFDVTPAQFAKDVLGGVINAVTSMVSMAAKGLPGGCNPYLWAQIDKAKNWVQSNVNQAIGANEGSLGYFMGETYAPAIAGGWFSAEIELANATAQTGKTLPFLGTEPYPLIVEGQVTAETGFGNLSQAQEYGIKPYNQLKKSTTGTDLQSHHLIEKRFEKTLKLKKGQMKSIVVTKPEHQVFTNAWRSLISYGKETRFATPEEIYKAAERVYAGYTAILKALGL